MKIKQLLTKTLLVAVCLLAGQSVWGKTTAFSQDFTGVGEPVSTSPSDYGFALSYGSGSSAEKVAYSVTDGVLKCEANAGEAKARTGLALATFSEISSNKIITLSYKWQITGAFAGANTETYIGNSTGKALKILWEPTGGTTSQGNLTINGNNAFDNTDQRALRGSTYTVTATLDLGKKKITSLVMTNSASSTWNYTLSGELDFASDISTIDRFGFSNQSKSNYTLTTSLDELLIEYKAYYDYTINAVDASDNVLETFATGTYTEGDDAISYFYPAKMLIGNTLYSIAYNSSNPRYTTSFTPDADNYVKNVKYAESTVSNVICYMEAEDISGVSKGTNNNWASMNKYGYTTNSSTFVEVMTIPAGTYQIYARMDVGNSESNRYCKFKVGDEEKLSLNVTTRTVNNLGNSDEFTITSPTKLYFACDGGSSTGCDWFYIKGTIDEGADVTGLIVNADTEIAASGSGFQEAVKGWSNTDNVVNYRRLAITEVQNPNGAFTGTYAYENWTDAAGGLVGQMSQTIQGLPNGVYELKLAALVRTVNGQFIYGKSNGKTYQTSLSGDNGQANDYSVIVVVEDNQLEIGLDMNGAGADWAAIDNARLIYMPTVSKSISAAGWATYCSPYALDLSKATGLTDAYIVTGGENSVLAKTSVKGGTVPANTGLLLKGPAGTATIPVVASGDASNVTGNKLVGVTAETPIGAEAGYVLLKENDVLGFYKNTYAFTLGANTAYLPVNFDQTVAARASYLLFDDMTGISQVAGSKVKTNGAIYNLNGQRVSNPTKGIYIIDGVKVAIE